MLSINGKGSSAVFVQEEFPIIIKLKNAINRGDIN
jgi:hypothetical protein